MVAQLTFNSQTMKVIEVEKLSFSTDFPALEEISRSLDNLKKEHIDVLNWSDYNYKPDVNFSIGYTDKEIDRKSVV